MVGCADLCAAVRRLPAARREVVVVACRRSSRGHRAWRHRTGRAARGVVVLVPARLAAAEATSEATAEAETKPACRGLVSAERQSCDQQSPNGCNAACTRAALLKEWHR